MAHPMEGTASRALACRMRWATCSAPEVVALLSPSHPEPGLRCVYQNAPQCSAYDRGAM